MDYYERERHTLGYAITLTDANVVAYHLFSLGIRICLISIPHMILAKLKEGGATKDPLHSLFDHYRQPISRYIVPNLSLCLQSILRCELFVRMGMYDAIHPACITHFELHNEPLPYKVTNESRTDLLEFPERPPPRGMSHFVGRFDSDGEWRIYDAVKSMSHKAYQLPPNVSQSASSWDTRWYIRQYFPHYDFARIWISHCLSSIGLVQGPDGRWSTQSNTGNQSGSPSALPTSPKEASPVLRNSPKLPSQPVDNTPVLSPNNQPTPDDTDSYTSHVTTRTHNKGEIGRPPPIDTHDTMITSPSQRPLSTRPGEAVVDALSGHCTPQQGLEILQSTIPSSFFPEPSYSANVTPHLSYPSSSGFYGHDHHDTTQHLHGSSHIPGAAHIPHIGHRHSGFPHDDRSPPHGPMKNFSTSNTHRGTSDCGGRPPPDGSGFPPPGGGNSPPGGPGDPYGSHGRWSGYGYPTGPAIPPPIRIKFDIDKLPDLVDPSKFSSWELGTCTYCIVAGLHEPLLNQVPDYATLSMTGLQVWTNKNTFFYYILTVKIKFIEGKAILDRYAVTMDGAQAFHEIRIHCTQSPSAVLSRQELYRNLISTRLKSSFTGSLEYFITTWQVRVDRYNRDTIDGSDVITPPSLHTHLEYMVMEVPQLAGIVTCEADNFIYTGRRFTLNQYMSLLKSQAQRLDIARGTKSKAREAVDRQLYESHLLHDNTDSTYSNGEEDVDAPTTMTAYEARCRRPFRPRMDKATWESLPTEDQAVWDTLSGSTKAIILGYREKRLQASRDASAQRETNVHSLLYGGTDMDAGILDDTISQGSVEDDLLANHTETSSSSGTDHAQAVRINETKGSAHPGNVKRLLSSKGSKASTLRVDKPLASSLRKANSHEQPPMEASRSCSMAIQLDAAPNTDLRTANSVHIPLHFDDDQSVDHLSFALSEHSGSSHSDGEPVTYTESITAIGEPSAVDDTLTIPVLDDYVSHSEPDILYRAYMTRASPPLSGAWRPQPYGTHTVGFVSQSAPSQYYHERACQSLQDFVAQLHSQPAAALHMFTDANLATNHTDDASDEDTISDSTSVDSSTTVPDLVYYPHLDHNSSDEEDDAAVRPQHQRLPASHRLSNYFLTHDGEMLRAAMGDPDSVLELPYRQDNDPLIFSHVDVPDYRERLSVFDEPTDALTTGIPDVNYSHGEIKNLSNLMGSTAINRSLDTTQELTDDEGHQDF